MTPAWFKLDADAWPLAVEAFQAQWSSSGGWPVELMRADLRWLWNRAWLSIPLDANGERSGAPRARVPNDRALAERWGVSRRQAAKQMRDMEAWVDHGAPWAWLALARRSKTEPRPSQDRSKTEPPENGQSTTTAHVRAESDPKAIRKRSESGDTRVGEQEQEQQQEELLSPQASDDSQPRKQQRQIPDALLEAYGAYRRTCGITREVTLTAYKGQGLDLWRLHEAHKADAVRLFGWLAASGHDRAQFYRRNRYTAENVRRHADALLDIMSAPQAMSSDGAPQATALADVWERAAQASSYQHPAWLEHVPEPERDRFARASAKVGGVGALGRCAHPLDTKALKQRFTQAYEAAA